MAVFSDDSKITKLSADMVDRGISLSACPHGGISVFDIADWIMDPPIDSRTFGALTSTEDDSAWALYRSQVFANHLSNDILHALSLLLWAKGGGKGKKPKPSPSPISGKSTSKNKAGKSVTAQDFTRFYASALGGGTDG